MNTTIPARTGAGRLNKLAVAAISLAAIAASGFLLFGVGAAAEPEVPATASSTDSVPPVTNVSVPVENTEDIRCYYRADLERTYPEPNAPEITMPPFLLTGIMSTPTHEDPESRMLPIEDPIELCTRLWDTNDMNPGGITDDLIPKDFITPAGTTSTGDVQHGHFVPELTECVIEVRVAVIPGPSSVCGELGIPARQKS